MELLTVDIDGPVHYHDAPGPGPDAPVAVLVHGLGASHVSWHPLIPLLTTTHRVLAPDLVGFGHSAPVGRDSTIAANTELLRRFLDQVAGGPVTLFGNSMGGMVSALLASAHPTAVDGLVLVNPARPGVLNPRGLGDVDPQLALHFALYNTPFVGERFLRFRRSRSTPAQQVATLLEQVCSDASRVPADTVELLIELTATRRRYSWSDRAFLTAERSLMRQLTLGRKDYLEVLHGLPMPTLLVHGEDDRLVRVATAVAVAPGNPRMELVTLPGVGHAPQLEAPEQLHDAVRRWLAATRHDVT